MDIADFADYLRQLDPEVSYSIDTVDGGVVNVTIRALKGLSDISKGRFPNHASLILKYAPPYVAKVGESAPFDQHRQTIEARALSLFTSSSSPTTSGATLADLAKSTKVAVPELLYHDPDAHILVIGDLGVYPDLSHLFFSLGGNHPSLEPTSSYDIFANILTDNTELGASAAASHTTYFQEIGTRVGSFFARLHSPKIRSQISSHQAAFNNPNARCLVLEHVIKPAVQDIQRFLGPQSREDDAEICRKVMLQDTQRPLPEEETSFTLGDCWTSAILVSLPPTASLQQQQDPPMETTTMGVIDWEFAGFGRGVHGDMAQLMAHLEMLRISASQDPKFVAQLRALNQLVRALTSSYSSCSSSGQQVENNKEDLKLRAVKMRSAFIACGTEMVSCASWKKWVCVMPECHAHNKETGQEPTDPWDCLLVKEILEEGIRLILLAGEDIASFGSASNRLRIEETGRSKWRKDQKWLIDLF